MTEKEFGKKFHGVISPKYRGAPTPKFDPVGINEQKFSDDLRFKEYDIDLESNADGEIAKVVIDWRSQCWDPDGIDGVVDEVTRCFKNIGYDGDVELHIYDRDGEGDEVVQFKVSERA